MLPMQELNLQTIDNLYETIRKNIANFQDILQEENRKLMNRDYANEEEKAEKEELIKEMEFAKTQSNNILRKIGQAREEYIKSKGNLRPDFITMFEQFGLSPSEQIHTKSRSELDLRKSAQMESDHHGADDDDVQVLRTSYVYHEEVSRSSPVLTSPNRSFHTSPAASPTKGGFTSPSSPRPENPRGSNSPSRAKPNSLADSPQRSPSKDLRSPNQFVTTTTTTTTSTPSRVTYVQEEYSYQSSQYVHQPSRSPRSPPSNEKDKLNLLELPSPPRRSLEEPKTHRNRILREEFKEETPKVFAIPKFDLEVREEVHHPEISRFTPSSARFPEELQEDEESESEEQQEEAIDQSYDEDYEEMELMELLKAQQQEQERRENRYARSSNQIPLDDSDEKVDEEDSLEDMDLEDIGISDTDRSMKELLDSLIPSSSVTTAKKETQDNKINEDLQRENTGLKQDIDSQRRDNEEMQARVNELLKTLNKKEDEITELRNSTKSQEQYISKLLKALKKKTSECNDIREERNKIRKIAESLAVHVESLQNTNLSVQNEQVQQQRELVDKHQKYSDAIETMVKKDNSLLKQYIDQMKRELQMRKTVFGEEILRLKKLVVETLEKDGDEELALGLSENEIMQTRDSSHLLASLNESASISLHQTIQNSWYTPTDSNDALDYAVNETLKIVNCPVRIEVERLGQGEYMVDRRLKLRVVNGQVVVRNGGMYETFVEYIRKLYRPFFTSQQLLDNGEELTDTSIVDTSIEDLAASIQSELSRSGAKVAEEEESLLREAENSIQKFMFAREHSNQSSPTSKQRTPLKSDVQNVQSPPRITPQTRRDIKGSESPDGRSNSAPTKSRGSVTVSESQTRYTQILKAAAQKNKLTPIRNQAEKKPTVNSSKGRSSSPAQKLAPRVEKVATESGTKRKQSPYRQEYEQRQKAKEEKIQQSETTAVKIKLTKHTTSTKSSLLEGVDLNDRAKLEQLRRLALKKQIQQMNSRKL